MLSLNNHSNSLWVHLLLNGVGDFLSEAFLDLQAPCKQFNETNHFAQANHLAGRQVTHMAFSEEGQEVVLAQTVNLNIPDNYHLVILDIKEGALENVLNILGVTLGQKLQRLNDPSRCLPESLTLRIFTEFFQNVLNPFFHEAPFGAMTSGSGLSRRPIKGSSAHQMKMDVKDRLPRSHAVVKDHPIPVREVLIFGYLAGHQEEVAQQASLLFGSFGKGRNMLFGNDQNMGRRLRVDIPKRHRLIVLTNDVRLHLSLSNFAKNTTRHKFSLPYQIMIRFSWLFIRRATKDRTPVDMSKIFS